MKSLASYTKNNYNKFANIDESLANNVRMINESQLVQEHGKYLDSAMNKFGLYTYNNLYNQNFIQESNNQVFELTLNEQNAVRDLFIYVCEDYKEQLLKELNIYENLLAGNESILTESLVNEDIDIVNSIKSVWAKGKEKAAEVVDNIKIKIEAAKTLIHDFANKTIKTVKDMADRAMELLEKFNCTISALFEKMGFDVKKQEEDINAIGQELAKDPKKINNNDIYGFKSEVSESFESYARIISEAEEAGDTVNQKKGIKEMIWKGFKQFLVWASVCVVIPGVVCAVFPGTFIALLVPLACKLAWNGYKIYKLWKQWKEIRKNWSNYNTKQKWLTVIGIIISIIALAANFNSLIGDSGKILSAFTKSGCDLLGKANLGIQPDVLTRGFAAGVKNIMDGKWPWEDFGKAFKGITDSFAEHIQIDKVIEKITYAGKNASEIANELPAKPFSSSMKALKWLKEQGMDPSKLKPSGKYTIFLNGHSDASWFKTIENAVGKVAHDDILNGPLHKVCAKAGSIVQCEMTGEQIQTLIKKGIDLGYQNHFSIIGGAVSELTHTVTDVVNAATSMLITIPTVEITPENGGFRIRLGEKDSKNNIYEIGEKDIKVEKANTYKQYEEILKHTVGKNKQYIEQLEKALKEEKSDDKKQEIKENIDKFRKEFDTIKNEDAYIFYGTKVEQSDAKESFKSLHDFLMIKEDDNKSENKKEDNESTKEIENLFNGKELSDDDKKKVIELLKNKFKDLTDDEFNKLIKDIDSLAKKLNESLLITEGGKGKTNKEKTAKNYYSNLKATIEKNLKDIENNIKNINNDDNIVNTLIDVLDGSDISNDEISEIEEKYKKLLEDTKAKYEEFKKKVEKLGDGHIKNFKDENKRKEIDDELKNINKSFEDGLDNVFSINKEEIKSKAEDIKNDGNNKNLKKLEILMKYQNDANEIFNEWEQFLNDKNIKNSSSLDIQKNNRTICIAHNTKHIDKVSEDELQKSVDKMIDDHKKAFEDDKNSTEKIINNTSKSSDDLFAIYKNIITLLLKNNKFKDDVKSDQNDLVKDPDIKVEGYVSLTDKLLFEDEESLTDKIKKKFKQLKEYILGKDLDSSDDEENKNDDNSSSDSSSNDDNSSSDSSEENGKENDGKQIPVLMIANNYVVDLADANDSGPRKETFTLPYLYENYEFITIEGKLSKENLITMFGNFIQKQTSRLYNYVVMKPCKKKKLSKKYKALDEPKGEREEFGNLTNADITAILNDSKKAREYVTGSTPNITEIAKDEEDIKYKDEKKKKYEEKLKNADEETIKMVKDIDKNAVDDNGKIKQDKISDIATKLSSYKLAQHKAKKTKKSSGFFATIKDFVRGIFGGNKDKGKKYNGLLKKFDESLNESKFDYDEFIEEMFAEKTFVSFKDYVYEKYNKQ